MVENGPYAKAYQAIGEYFCAFSELERELGEALKVVLRLEGNVAADAIVALVGDFARKARVVREAVQGAKHVDGTEPTGEWKARADKTMGEVLGCNQPGRVDLAHDYLEPQPGGSVSLQKPGQHPRSWTSADLAAKIKKLKELTVELQTVRADLTTLKIPVPSGWMMMGDPYQPRPRQYPPSDLTMGNLEPPRLPLNTQNKKD